ncbi:hypothetical protein ACJ73_03747 [Blastomyces percursus]|uniref:Uncharacterized protein n=1 Tax=Blastomyces percursus TaxID=1658174 RepID=A0A1J9RA64_9EURO|nr:hypothetical protein ACJ73_03747 [Blastomyces percursus]
MVTTATKVAKEVGLPIATKTLLLACEILAYKLAAHQVKYTFMSGTTNTPFKALFFTILAVGGRELTAAFQEREPLALEKQYHVVGWEYWVGIVDEISEVLVTSPFVRLAGVGETIMWARREVGLDSELESGLSSASLSFPVLLESRCGGLSTGAAGVLPIQDRSTMKE